MSALEEIVVNDVENMSVGGRRSDEGVSKTGDRDEICHRLGVCVNTFPFLFHQVL
jgi:hypothetical protein